MKLVTLTHGHLFLVLLEIVVDCLKLRNFQETQVNLNELPDKPDIIVSIAELLIRNLMSQVAKLFQRTRTIKDHQFFPKSLGTWVENFFIYWRGGTI